jgi:SAM-dependent methyltransferase
LNPFIFVLGNRLEISYPEFINQWEQRACRVFKGTPEEAAHIKYLSNIWNALRIAFVNELGDSIGLPQDEKQRKKIESIIDFLFEKKGYLRYGQAFGGHCLPKDTRAFMAYKEETRPSPLLRAIHESNNLHKQIEKDYALPQWFSSWDYAAYRQGIRGISGRLWQNLNSLKAAKSTRRFFKPVVRFLEPLAAKKSAPQLNKTWEKLAKKNPYYYSNPNKKRPDVDEFELRQSGKEDYLKYVAGDALLQKLLSDLKNRSVLEIGTGVGRMTEFFSQDFGTVHSIDISPTMLAIARKRLNLFTNINLVKNEGNDIPFPNGNFDFIFSYLVFNHLPAVSLVKDYFTEIARTLKSDGLAKIQVRTGAAPYFWQWFYGVSLSPEKADNLANNTGLQIIKSEIENGKNLWLWLKKI